MNAIKVISFDLDDTLWPCLPTILYAEKCLYEYLETNVPEITQRYTQEQLRQKRNLLLQQRDDLQHDLTQLRRLSFEQLNDELGLNKDRSWITEAFDVFYQARQQVTLFEDVKPVLDELCTQYRLVSLTNGNASTVETGVDHWFDLALSSASVGKMKSEPDIYHQVQQSLGVLPKEMVHIGDHPTQDIAGAKLAGSFAIWLNREDLCWQQEGYQPDAIIQTLHELPELLKQNRLG